MLTSRFARLIGLSMVTVAALLALAPSVDAQVGGLAGTPAYAGNGVAAAVFLGGNVDHLELAASAAGAGEIWAQDATGKWALLLIGGPAFVNSGFRTTFSAGFPTATAVMLTKARQALPVPGAPVVAPPVVGTWVAAQAPSGAPASSSDWIAVAAPDGKTIMAQVIRPAGTGPFPAVVLLHSQSGFSTAYLELGAELAQSGYVVVVGCWFGGNYDGSTSTDTPAPMAIPGGTACPAGPTLKSIASPAAADDVIALVKAAKTLPGVKSDRVALVGNSRGSIVAVLTAALSTEPMQAVVAIGGAPLGGPLLAMQITEPLLLLQGDADSVVPVTYAQSLEQSLLVLGRTVQSHYYPNAGHGILFDTPYHADAMSRVAAFLGLHLGN